MTDRPMKSWHRQMAWHCLEGGGHLGEDSLRGTQLDELLLHCGGPAHAPPCRGSRIEVIRQLLPYMDIERVVRPMRLPEGGCIRSLVSDVYMESH